MKVQSSNVTFSDHSVIVDLKVMHAGKLYGTIIFLSPDCINLIESESCKPIGMDEVLQIPE